jgi:hypothetical protein
MPLKKSLMTRYRKFVAAMKWLIVRRPNFTPRKKKSDDSLSKICAGTERD